MEDAAFIWRAGAWIGATMLNYGKLRLSKLVLSSYNGNDLIFVMEQLRSLMMATGDEIFVKFGSGADAF